MERELRRLHHNNGQPAPTNSVHTIRLRWRMASDTSISVQGWHIDNVVVTDCTAPEPPTPTPTPPTATPTPTTTPFGTHNGIAADCDNGYVCPDGTIIIQPVTVTTIDPVLITSGFLVNLRMTQP